MEDYRTPLKGNLLFSFLTGSSVICDPPVLDTDRDVAILVRSLDKAFDSLFDNDWHVTDEDPEYRVDLNGEINFLTARKGKPVSTNLIMFEEEEGYRAFENATAVCKKLNLRNKEDRVAVFQAVCSGRRDGWHSAAEMEDLFNG